MVAWMAILKKTAITVAGIIGRRVSAAFIRSRYTRHQRI
jgi:hypothetical protein